MCTILRVGMEEPFYSRVPREREQEQGGQERVGMRVVPGPHSICTGYGNPYHGWMNITLSLDDAPVKKVRKIALERDTTLTGMVRDYLERLAEESASSGRRKREQEALERTFDRFRFRVGKRTSKRADLYARS